MGHNCLFFIWPVISLVVFSIERILSEQPTSHLALFSPLLCFSLSPSLQILMSALKESTTAGRTPCALTPPVPLCVSAIRATSGSMTIPAQVSSYASLLTVKYTKFWFYSTSLFQLFCEDIYETFKSYAQG